MDKQSLERKESELDELGKLEEDEEASHAGERTERGQRDFTRVGANGTKTHGRNRSQ